MKLSVTELSFFIIIISPEVGKWGKIVSKLGFFEFIETFS